MALKNYDSGVGPGTLLNPEHAKLFPTPFGKNYPRQGTLFIQAATKQEAADKLNSLGYRWLKPRELRVGMGNTLDALDDAGLMATGDLFIVADYGHVVRVTLVDGMPVAKYFGRIEQKPVFVPAD